MPNPRIHMGTSGWYYRDWPGTFYPVHLKKQNFLACYAESFKTVELNGTFYHLPLDSTAKTWYRSTPRDFVFSVKANPWSDFSNGARFSKKNWARSFSSCRRIGAWTEIAWKVF